MEERVLLVKYGEIAMRGNNRQLFVKRLVDTIRKNIDSDGDFYVVREQGRLIVESRGSEINFDTMIPKINRIFGILGVCPGIKVKDQDIENLKRVSLEFLKENLNGKADTFKVVTKRSNKKYPLTSNEISAEVGGYIFDNYEGMKVDLHSPNTTLYIEIRNDAYIYTDFIEGCGGLPYGSSGKAVSLISGGIDSPVATWMMAKRGVEVSGVYFHSPPYTGERAKEKVKDLAGIISMYTGGFKLYVVKFTEVQLYLLENVPEDKLTIFLKRAMMRTAEKIAAKEHADGLITGESAGQVASQTMQGINAINAVCTIPVMRPLCGMDKQEIVDKARKIGTFETSILPYEDCCTIFVAKHPETRPKTSVINKIESKLEKLDELIEKAFEEMELYEL
ncbi:tRNA 4-thiouridine(8) synthase ThiI [Lachnospiraceae bacterium NSJ-143]|nr:tRNA 4-thiouridine(8) synthase ThiI [Lachnospiraceae bacterium NSJ-143]